MAFSMNITFEKSEELMELTANISKKAIELQEAIQQLNEFEVKISTSAQ